MNTLPRTVIKAPDGGWTGGETAPLVPGTTRYAAQRRQVRKWVIISAVVMALGYLGSGAVEFFFPGSWAYFAAERDYLANSIAILGPLFIPTMLWFFWVHPLRRLPRLDPVSRSATVTGLHTVTTHRDPEGPSGPPIPHHHLVEFQLDFASGRSGEKVLLADVIAEQDLDRFAPGTSWRVRVFEKRRGRVLLAVDHDDVVRVGRDLRTVRRGFGLTTVSRLTRTDADAAGPGSTLLPWCRR